MNRPCVCKDRIPGFHGACKLTHYRDSFTCQDNVQLVLIRVDVRRMFLTGFEAVQPGRQVLPACNTNLAHFVGLKRGQCRNIVKDHNR